MSGILDGIRVFDLTVAAVGPWATKLLGELGADVIKVEAPGGDNLSHGVPPKIKGSSVLYISGNYNKRMIELNLKHEADRAIALKIVEQCDVFVNNMRPGAVERLGLSYDVAAGLNPKIVYVVACAYGRVGPMAQEAVILRMVWNYRTRERPRRNVPPSRAHRSHDCDRRDSGGVAGSARAGAHRQGTADRSRNAARCDGDSDHPPR
jgi:hypothetical protein